MKLTIFVLLSLFSLFQVSATTYYESLLTAEEIQAIHKKIERMEKEESVVYELVNDQFQKKTTKGGFGIYDSVDEFFRAEVSKVLLEKNKREAPELLNTDIEGIKVSLLSVENIKKNADLRSPFNFKATRAKSIGNYWNFSFISDVMFGFKHKNSSNYGVTYSTDLEEHQSKIVQIRKGSKKVELEDVTTIHSVESFIEKRNVNVDQIDSVKTLRVYIIIKEGKRYFEISEIISLYKLNRDNFVEFSFTNEVEEVFNFRVEYISQ